MHRSSAEQQRYSKFIPILVGLGIGATIGLLAKQYNDNSNIRAQVSPKAEAAKAPKAESKERIPGYYRTDF